MGENWLRRFRQTASGPVTLYCLPHAGGAASAFFDLAQALDGRADVAAVQYPGRQDRMLEPVLEDIGALADRIAAVIADDRPGPFALLGHSMGAVVAFEVARRLAATGAPGPRLLVVSAHRAPSIAGHETNHLLGDDDLLASVTTLSGDELPAVTDPELVSMILPAIRGDYRAIETWPASDAVVDVPLLVLGGTHDPAVATEDVRAWAAHTSAGADVHLFDGGHFFLYRRESEVADLVAGRLRPPDTEVMP